jgi:hypothetical protein
MDYFTGWNSLLSRLSDEQYRNLTRAGFFDGYANVMEQLKDYPPHHKNRIRLRLAMDFQEFRQTFEAVAAAVISNDCSEEVRDLVRATRAAYETAQITHAFVSPALLDHLRKETV